MMTQLIAAQLTTMLKLTHKEGETFIAKLLFSNVLPRKNGNVRHHNLLMQVLPS